MYLAPLAGVPLALRKVNEAEPTFTSTRDIPGFEVFMSYPSTVKVPYQLIHLRSAGNRHRQWEQLLRHDCYRLPLRIGKLSPLIQNAIT
jgi:hypothetical protein